VVRQVGGWKNAFCSNLGNAEMGKVALLPPWNSSVGGGTTLGGTKFRTLKNVVDRQLGGCGRGCVYNLNLEFRGEWLPH
jgi:hypothetical protein